MKTGRPGKIIMCINDGHIYTSLEAAAIAYQTTRSSISKHIHGNRKSVKGFYFVEITGDESIEECEQIRLQHITQKYNLNLKTRMIVDE